MKPITTLLENLDAQERILFPDVVKSVDRFDDSDDDQFLAIEGIGTIADIRDRRRQVYKRVLI